MWEEGERGCREGIGGGRRGIGGRGNGRKVITVCLIHLIEARGPQSKPRDKWQWQKKKATSDATHSHIELKLNEINVFIS